MRRVWLAPLLCALAACASVPGEAADDHGFAFRSVTTVPAGAAAQGAVRVWIPVPASNGYQDVSETRVELQPPAPGAWRLTTDPRTGNRMVFLTVGPERAGTDVTVSVSCRVLRRASNPGGLPDGGGGGDPSAFLGAQRLIPLDGPVGQRADAVPAGPDALATGRALFDDVLASMTYDKDAPGWGRGDAVRACRVGKGNCTDFHSLFIGMARARGIPARFTIGYGLRDARAGEARLKGYHCWAEFHVPGRGWIPVDISEADQHPDRVEDYFGRLPPDRVALSTGRDLRLVPAQSGQPLNWLLAPYAEQGGVPFEGLRHEAAAGNS